MVKYSQTRQTQYMYNTINQSSLTPSKRSHARKSSCYPAYGTLTLSKFQFDRHEIIDTGFTIKNDYIKRVNLVHV